VNRKIVGNKVSWRVVCPKGEGEGEITYHRTTYDGFMQMKAVEDGQTMTMNLKLSGRHLGPCPTGQRSGPTGETARQMAVAEQAIAVLLVVAPGGFTVSRNTVYRSQVALWEDTARKSPGKARVRNNLGYAYELEGRFEEAEAAYLKALLNDPGYSLARWNLKGMTGKWKTPGSPAPPASASPPPAGAAPAREAAPAAPGG